MSNQFHILSMKLLCSCIFLVGFGYLYRITLWTWKQKSHQPIFGHVECGRTAYCEATAPLTLINENKITLSLGCMARVVKLSSLASRFLLIHDRDMASGVIMEKSSLRRINAIIDQPLIDSLELLKV